MSRVGRTVDQAGLLRWNCDEAVGLGDDGAGDVVDEVGGDAADEVVGGAGVHGLGGGVDGGEDGDGAVGQVGVLRRHGDHRGLERGGAAQDGEAGEGQGEPGGAGGGAQTGSDHAAAPRSL